VKLSLREKRNFYHELGRLIRAGRTFANGIDVMAENTHGNLRRFLRRLHAAALRGESVADAFVQQRPAVSEMEISILTASERAGRLDHACEQLSSYFGALENARAAVLKRSAYPAFVLHFGVFILAAPKLALGGTVVEYAKQTVGFLLMVYAAVTIVFALVKQLARAGESNAQIDAVLRALPIFGKLRRSFSLARFCATYEAQLGAGVNVLDALSSAAQAGRSGVITQSIDAALPQIRAGAQVGPLLQNSRAFPSSMTRAFRLAEETGELDQELQRLTHEFEQEALSRVETVSEWLPKIVYLLVVLYLAYQMIGIYQRTATEYGKLLDL